MIIMKKCVAAIVLGCVSLTALAHNDRFSKVEITRQDLGHGVYMLTGSGGNIGVSAGDDGILIVDDQFAPLADKIAAALKDINPAPLKFIVNTHHHGDHTGGNAAFAEQAVIMAHDNVRTRMQQDSRTDVRGLPVLTYAEGIKVYFNNDVIRVEHLQPSHTDGDSVIFFEGANVLHAGDLFFNKRFPFIDLNGGGSVTGFVANIEYLVEHLDDDAKIIPGHGDLANKADLMAYLNMLNESVAQVQSWKKQGLSVEQAQAEGLDEKYQSWGWNFISEDRWIETLYNGLTESE